MLLKEFKPGTLFRTDIRLAIWNHPDDYKTEISITNFDDILLILEILEPRNKLPEFLVKICLKNQVGYIFVDSTDFEYLLTIC